MSTIAFPDFFEAPSAFSLRMSSNQIAFGSPFGGSEQVVERLNDRWYASLTVPNRTHIDAARLEAVVASFRGMFNTIDLYHLKRLVPQGTLAGAPTARATAAGANTVLIDTTAAATLLAGDMFGVGGLLLMVEQDAVANGAGLLSVRVVNRLRRAITAGTPVIWNKPTAPFRKISDSSVEYLAGYSPELSFDFVGAI